MATPPKAFLDPFRGDDMARFVRVVAPGGRVCFDATIASGNATITSPTAKFTTDDIGTHIFGTGIAAGTTISGVSANGTQATLSATASSSSVGVGTIIVRSVDISGYTFVSDIRANATSTSTTETITVDTTGAAGGELVLTLSAARTAAMAASGYWRLVATNVATSVVATWVRGPVIVNRNADPQTSTTIELSNDSVTIVANDTVPTFGGGGSSSFSGAASDVTFSPTGTISSTNVQAAIAEVASEAGTGGGGTAATTTFTPTGTIAATDVQAALAEVATEYAAADATETAARIAADALSLLKANNLSDLANAGTARTNLGLGTAATTAATAYDAAGAAAAAQAASQPSDADLTAIAALTTTSFGRAFLTLADATATRAAIGAVIGTDVEAHDTDLTTIAALAASNDDIIQRKAGAWTNRTVAQYLTDLGLAALYQPLDSDLTAIAALSTSSYGRALLTVANLAALQAILGTGTPSASTYLRGDGSWSTPAGSAYTAANGLTLTSTAFSIDTAITVDKTTAQTLTNKTLTSPAINTPTGIVKGDVGLGNVSNALQLVAANNLTDLVSMPTARYNMHDQVLAACTVVSIANVASKSGTTTIDGVALVAGNTVLLTAQTATAENGPWTIAAGAWTRTSDYPAAGTVIARIIEVQSGTTYAGTVWCSLATSAVTVDTTGTTWVQINKTYNDARYLKAASNGTDIASTSTFVSNLGLSGALALTKFAAGFTPALGGLDRWKAGTGKLGARLLAPMLVGDTTISLVDTISTTTVPRRLFVEDEIVWVTSTSAGSAFSDGQTNSNTTVNSGASRFAATDVGRLIVGGTIPKDTYITAYTNGTTVTISQAATSTTGTVTTMALGELLTVVRGEQGTTAAAHAAGVEVLRRKARATLVVGDSIVEGISTSTTVSSDPFLDRFFRAVSEKYGGALGKGWGNWRNTSAGTPHHEWAFSGFTTSTAGTTSDVGHGGTYVASALFAGTTNFWTWTRPGGEQVQAVDINIVDVGSASCGGSYSLDGGATWVNFPITTRYVSGTGILRSFRVSCDNPDTIKIRAATAAGTGNIIVLPSMTIFTYATYPTPFTDGVHMFNFGWGGIKLRQILGSRTSTDGSISNGGTTLTSTVGSPAALDVNSTVYIEGVPYIISSVSVGTSWTISTPYAGATLAGTGRVTVFQGDHTGDRTASMFGHPGSANPDLIFIGTCTNDQVATTPSLGDGNENAYYDNYTYLVTKAKAQGADVVILAPYERNPATSATAIVQAAYRAVLHTVATEQTVAIFDIYDLMVGWGITGYAAANAQGWYADGTHPSELGHQFIAARLTDMLEFA